MVDELIDLAGRIKLLVPARVVKELCKQKHLRAKSNADRTVLLAQALTNEEILQLFEECTLERFLSICIYKPKQKYSLKKDDFLIILKSKQLEKTFNETGSEKESHEIKKKYKSAIKSPFDINVIETRFFNDQMEFYFRYAVEREYFDYDSESVQTYRILRMARAVFDIKRQLFLVFTRNHDDANKIRGTIEKLLDIRFNYCFFSETQMGRWKEWAKNLKSSQLHTSSFSQMSRIRIGASREDGDLRKDDEYAALENESQKNGLYILFEHEDYDLGLGINNFGKVYFRNHITSKELEFVLNQIYDITSTSAGLPIVADGSNIKPQDYLEKIIPYLLKSGELKEADFDDEFTAAEFITALNFLGNKMVIKASREYICTTCGGHVSSNLSKCFDCNADFLDLKTLPFQTIYFVGRSEVRLNNVDLGFSAWVYVSADNKISVETPTYHASEFDVFKGIFDIRYRNIKRIMKKVAQIRENDGRSDFDLSKIFSRMLGTVEHPHCGLEVADIPGIQGGIKYQGKEKTYAAVIKSAISGKLTGKKGDTTVRQIADAITKIDPEVLFLITTADIQPYFLSGIKLLCKKTKTQFVLLDLRTVSNILLKYKLICKTCGSPTNKQKNCTTCLKKAS